MSGGKGVIFRTAHSQPIPNVLRFHRWPCSAGCDLDRATKKTRHCERDQHREKNPLPLLVSTPESDPQQNQTNKKVFRPIAKPADVLHKSADASILMLRHEITDGAVEMKSRHDRQDDNDDSDQPIKNSGALHKRFTGRYFETAFEIGNSQLRPSFFRLRYFSRPR